MVNALLVLNVLALVLLVSADRPIRAIYRLNGSSIGTNGWLLAKVILNKPVLDGSFIDVDLAAGNLLPGNNIPLRITYRGSDKRFYANSFLNGHWGTEMIGGVSTTSSMGITRETLFSLTPGKQFDVYIAVLPDRFEVSLGMGGDMIAKYPYQMPVSSITHMLFRGDVDIKLAALPDGYYPDNSTWTGYQNPKPTCVCDKVYGC